MDLCNAAFGNILAKCSCGNFSFPVHAEELLHFSSVPSITVQAALGNLFSNNFILEHFSQVFFLSFLVLALCSHHHHPSFLFLGLFMALNDPFWKCSDSGSHFLLSIYPIPIGRRLRNTMPPLALLLLRHKETAYVFVSM